MVEGGTGWGAQGCPREGIGPFRFSLTNSCTQPFREGVISIGPVGGAAIVGLAALGLLLHTVGLTALTRTPLQDKSKFSHQVQAFKSKLIKLTFQIPKLLCSHYCVKSLNLRLAPFCHLAPIKDGNPKSNFDHEKKHCADCLPVRPVWDDGAAVGSGAVGVVGGCVGREQGHNQEPLPGSRAPFLPTLMAG